MADPKRDQELDSDDPVEESTPLRDEPIEEPEEEDSDQTPPIRKTAPADLDDLAVEEEPHSSIPSIRPSGMSMNSNRPQSSYSSQVSYYDNPPGRSGGSKLGVILVGLIILGLIGGGLFFLRDKLLGGSKEKAQGQPEQTLVETATPQPSPTPNFDRSKYKIQVLNGTSKSGLAASVSAKLKDLGYQTDKTANATNSAFTTTVVRAKSTAAELVDQLIKDLSPDFEAQKGPDLKDSETNDGQIILGAK